MEQRIILNAILMTELNTKITEKMIEKLIREDTCMSVISKIKVSPILYNETGKYIIHLFYNLDTGKFSPIKKGGKKKLLNTLENRMTWGN